MSVFWTLCIFYSCIVVLGGILFVLRLKYSNSTFPGWSWQSIKSFSSLIWNDGSTLTYFVLSSFILLIYFILFYVFTPECQLGEMCKYSKIYLFDPLGSSTTIVVNLLALPTIFHYFYRKTLVNLGTNQSSKPKEQRPTPRVNDDVEFNSVPKYSPQSQNYGSTSSSTVSSHESL